MSTIVTRAAKGSALTHNEVDANFVNLNTDKIQSGDTVAALTIISATINGGTITGNLVVNGTTTMNGAAGSGYTGFKNRIINGDMRINQRNNGASVSIPSIGTPAYVVDRFFVSGSQTGKLTAQQNAGAVTPPAGFVNYVGVTSSSSYAVGASEAFYLRQHIEGLNTADLAFGTANASAVTFSFWVRSSLTGAFGGSLANSGFTRVYPFSYTISAANTWEQKTVTISGDTTGTWLTNNGTGFILTFGLGYGSSISGAANAWNAGTVFSPTGSVSIVGTSGATFYITGVQLERGSNATSFEVIDYGRQLMQCQRYCYVAKGFGGYSMLAPAYVSATTVVVSSLSVPVTMRTQPSATFSAANTFLIQQNGAINLIPSAVVATSGGANINSFGVTFTVAGALTASGGAVYDNNSTAAQITLSAEL